MTARISIQGVNFRILMRHPAIGEGTILALNGGSSSIKFSLFKGAECLVGGQIERIGLSNCRLSIRPRHAEPTSQSLSARNHEEASSAMLDALESHTDLAVVQGVGHRVVHGGPNYFQPTLLDDRVVAALRELESYDPDHLPAEISLIEFMRAKLPECPAVACFDTAFHHTMPRVAQIIPIPREYEKKGVRRYGFHGLSCQYLMGELERLAGEEAAMGRIIIAHLGNGASLTAVLAGKSVDTTMAFTPAAGIPMSTRSGDLDPGLVQFLSRTEGMAPEEFNQLVNHRSGLLGISETSSDMADLLAAESTDARAKEAADVFCYQTRKAIGALASVLGGLDTLVFSGGIGEHSAVIRGRICSGLEFLGVEIDEARNNSGEAVISKDGSKATVRVIPTDEEQVIAQLVIRVLTPSA